MTSIQRKVCLLGAAGVGKTSLVRRFVEGIFNQRYLSTIGVKIDRRVVQLDRGQVALVLWDIEGETEHRHLRARHLRGASAAILVADGTRAETLDVARELQRKAAEWLPGLPFVFLLNKLDLIERWALPLEAIAALRAAGWPVHQTSARTGDGVESAFIELAGRMLAGAR